MLRLRLLLAALVLWGCGETVEPVPVNAVFVLPRPGVEAPFFDLPWPTDIRLTDSGNLSLEGFPRTALIGDYIDAIEANISGYSVASPAYFHFSGPIDAASLPDSALAAQEQGASVFLVNIDPESPEMGQRAPVYVRFQSEERLYWGANTLSVAPIPGIPLRGATTYAAVVTNRVLTPDGLAVTRPAELDAVLRGEGDAAIQAAANIYQPAVATLESLGISAAEIVNLAVFTTQDPVGELFAAADWLAEQEPPEARRRDWAWRRTEPEYHVLHGRYDARSFQQGEIPFATSGGELVLDGDTPVVQDTYPARFSLTVPRTPMPESGYPIVIYAHGTGGDFESSEDSGLAERLAARGIATMGVDQIHHGTRAPDGANVEVLSFNVANPIAFRDNTRQAALDVVEQANFIAHVTVPDNLVATDEPIVFDRDSLFFFGHSQGGINGPLFLAADRSVRAAVLSGTGAYIPIALVLKTEPIDIPTLVRSQLRIPAAEELTIDHPVFAVLQTWVDVADPGNYASYLVENPRIPDRPLSLLQTEGVDDPFTPALSMETFATASRIPTIGEVRNPTAAQEVLGIESANGPVSGNIAGGQATGGLLQFSGGHFVAFQDARLEGIADFFASAVEGVPTIEALP